MTGRTPHFRGQRVGGAEVRQPFEPLDRPDWFTDRRRICATGRPDWRLWTSDEKADLNKAARLCSRRRCPFITECRAWAVENGEQHYAWGGLNLSTEAGRRVAKRTRGRVVHVAPKPAPVERKPPRLAGVELSDLVRELWEQGKTDGQISLRLGCHPSKIYKLRHRLGLPSKHGPRGKQQQAVPA